MYHQIHAIAMVEHKSREGYEAIRRNADGGQYNHALRVFVVTTELCKYAM